MNNKIPIINYWFDESISKPVIWSDEYMEDYKSSFTKDNIKNKKYDLKLTSYGHGPVLSLINILEKYNFSNLNVAVIGTLKPWIEAILINFNNNVTTVEYNVPNVNSKFLSVKSYNDFKRENNNGNLISP